MADANVTQLSDSELRKKLKDLGQSVGPITKTTRSIWEKKLERLLISGNPSSVTSAKEIVRKNPDSSRRRSSAATVGTSSTSSTTSSTNRRAPSPGRKSINTRGRKLAPFSSDEDEQDNVQVATTKRSIQTSPIGFPEEEIPSLSVGSSSLSRVRQRRTTITPIYMQSTFPSSSSSSSHQNSDKLQSPLIGSRTYETSHKRSEFSDNDDFAEQSKKYFQSKDDGSLVRPNGGFASTQSKYNSVKHKSPDVEQHRTNTKSTIKASGISPARIHELDSKIRDEIDASLIQIRNTFSAKKPSPISKHHPDTEEEEEDEELDAEFVCEKFSFKQLLKDRLFIKMATFGVLIIFVAVGLYFYQEQEDLTGIADHQNNDQMNEKESRLLVNCLYQKLSIKAGLKECGHTDSKWVNEMELRTTDCCKNVRGSQKEIQINKSLEMIKNHFSDYISYNNASVPSYASKASKRSLMCRISQAVSVIVSRIAVFCAVLVLGFAVYFFLKRRWTTDDEETRQMLYFVDKIIDTLRRHHEVCLNNKEIPPYLPIPHVRDMLIPLAKRKRMANIWQKAVEFLNSSDSRIRIETQRIAGEDFEVWRWIGVCTPKMKKSSKKHHISTNHAKYWQGPAFDEIEKVVRMPIVTPTPCLKIRYMHEGPDEKGDSWVTRVQDAILEKINKDGAQILHIYVDKTSKEGCVYVKCDSLNSAGKAFRSMYGNWFDGRLVIVKFVTLARYHQRFPDALGGSSPLKPSGTSESSLNWVQENDD